MSTCGCANSAKMGTCCTGTQTATAPPPKRPTADKPGHGTGRKP